MKIVFIEPKSAGIHVFSRYHLPRLGTVTLGTILRKAGHEVSVYCEEIKEIDLAEVFSADLVGISTTTSTAPRAYEIADLLRQQGIPVAMGGPHVTFLVEEALAHCDYVLVGEADMTVVRFLDALAGQRGLETVPGLCYRGADGQIRKNPLGKEDVCSDLDELPIPDLTLIRGWNEQPFIAPVMTSRGCPFDCSFCSVTRMFGRRFRVRSTDSVIEELKAIRSGYVFFYDDNFTANRGRTKELLRRVIDEGIRVKWMAQVRTDIADDDELLDLMHRSGCERLYIGLESINPETLRAYNKKQTTEDIEQAIRKLHDNKIYVHGMFVFGADEDSIDTIHATVRFSQKKHIDSLQYLILTPLPGTRYFDKLTQEGRLITTDWSLYDAHHAVFEPKLMTVYELQKETFRAMVRFYSWWSMVRKLIRWDFLHMFLRFYARMYLERWRRRNRENYRLAREWTQEKSRRLETYVSQTAEDLKARVDRYHIKVAEYQKRLADYQERDKQKSLPAAGHDGARGR